MMDTTRSNSSKSSLSSSSCSSLFASQTTVDTLLTNVFLRALRRDPGRRTTQDIQIIYSTLRFLIIMIYTIVESELLFFMIWSRYVIIYNLICVIFADLLIVYTVVTTILCCTYHRMEVWLIGRRMKFYIVGEKWLQAGSFYSADQFSLMGPCLFRSQRTYARNEVLFLRTREMH